MQSQRVEREPELTLSQKVGFVVVAALLMAAAALAPGCTSSPEPGEPDVAGAAAVAAPPLDLFPRPFRDLGVLREASGRVVRGADPELDRGADGVWYLHCTWGPTKPRAPGGTWPGIYRRTADNLAGPWSEMRLVLRADDGFDPRAAAQETISIDYVPAYGDRPGEWIGLIMEYTPGRTDSWLRLVSAPSLDAPFVKHRETVVRQFPWEAHYTPARGKPGTISEPAVVWSGPHGMLVAATATRSNKPDGVTWRNGIMASASRGKTWFRHPEPFLVAPGRFHLRGTINTHSQGCLLAEPRRPGWFHFFATVEGSVDIRRKGITSWLFDGVTWHPNPNGLLLRTNDVGTTHIGAPSVVIVEGRLVMVYAQLQEGGPTRLRMAEVAR